MRFDLSIMDAGAMYDLLRTVGPQGRTDVRKHAKIFAAFNFACRKFKDNTNTEFDIVAGTFEVNETAQLDYLKKILDAKIKHGVAGMLCESYVKFMDMLDPESLKEKPE